jgi:hypothetical protein
MEIEEFDKTARKIMKEVYSHPMAEPDFTSVDNIFNELLPNSYEETWDYLLMLNDDGWLELKAEWGAGTGFYGDSVQSIVPTFKGRYRQWYRAYWFKNFFAPLITGITIAVATYLLSRIKP